jgi:hypothetical protein
MKTPIRMTDVLRKRRIVVPAAVLALGAAGTGVALGKSTGGSEEPFTDAAFEVASGPGLAIKHAPRPDLLKHQADEFWGNVAEHLGVEQSALVDAFKEAAVDQVEAAKEDEDLTNEQAAELEQQIREGDLPPGPPIPFLGPAELAVPPGNGPIAAAADYLGLNDRELFNKLDDGSSLADVAEEQGKSVNGLEQAILDHARDQLDEAVENGKLDADQRDEMVDDLDSHLDEMVNGELPPVRRIRGGDLHRPGGPFMMAPPPIGFE